MNVLNLPRNRAEAQQKLEIAQGFKKLYYQAEYDALSWQMYELAKWLEGKSLYDIALHVGAMHDCEGLYLQVLLIKESEYTGDPMLAIKGEPSDFKCTFDAMRYIMQIVEKYPNPIGIYNTSYSDNRIYEYYISKENYTNEENRDIIVLGSPTGEQYIPRSD